MTGSIASWTAATCSSQAGHQLGTISHETVTVAMPAPKATRANRRPVRGSAPRGHSARTARAALVNTKSGGLKRKTTMSRPAAVGRLARRHRTIAASVATKKNVHWPVRRVTVAGAEITSIRPTSP